MSSYLIRPKAGCPIFAVLALLASLALPPIVCIADEPAGSEGPSLSSQPDKTPPADNSPPSDNAAQSNKSTPTEGTVPSVEGAPDENKTGTKANNESESKMRPEPAGQGEPAIEADKPATPEMKSDAAKRPEKAEGDEKNSDKAAAAEKKSEKAESEKVETVGEPLAPGMIKLLQDEIVAGFKHRRITDRFARFQSYAIGKVNSSAGRYTGSELAGNCRLRWYDHLMRNLLAAPAEAEQFTRELHMAAVQQSRRLGPGAGHGGGKDGFRPRKPRKAVPVGFARAGARSDQAGADRSASCLFCRLGAAEEVGDPRTAGESGARAVHAEPGGAHAGRPRHRPAAVRPDGKDGSRRPATRPPKRWPRSPTCDCWNNSSRCPHKATCESQA